MTLPTFKLEDYLDKYEFTAPYLLCTSDPESWTLNEILEMATVDEKNNWEHLRLNYTQVAGSPSLREALAHHLYAPLTADQLLCFSGAGDGIFCSLYALCNPGDHVVVITPAYQSLLEIPKMRGCHITQVPLCEKNNWELDLEALKTLFRQTPTKLLIINYPHNPTGKVLEEEQLKALIELLDAYGVYLFSDEVYRLLGTHQSPPSPAAVLYPRALSLGVTSKAFGLAGLRVGWVACQDRHLLKNIQKVKYYTSICCSALSEVITQIAIRNHKPIIQRNNHIIQENLEMLNSFINKYANYFAWVTPPQGGCVGLMHYKGPGSTEDFCHDLAKKKGVLLMPGNIFDMDFPALRVGFGRKNMPQALAQLNAYLEGK